LQWTRDCTVGDELSDFIELVTSELVTEFELELSCEEVDVVDEAELDVVELAPILYPGPGSGVTAFCPMVTDGPGSGKTSDRLSIV
jgi:hypothetical protein